MTQQSRHHLAITKESRHHLAMTQELRHHLAMTQPAPLSNDGRNSPRPICDCATTHIPDDATAQTISDEDATTQSYLTTTQQDPYLMTQQPRSISDYDATTRSTSDDDAHNPDHF
jgi:hypothetical protein